jgi:hypothetical protein
MNNNNIEQVKKEGRPKLNIVANIINTHFLDTCYQGKDWEAVRKSLIKELSTLEKAVREEERERKELEKAEQQILGFYHCSQGYDLESLISSMGLSLKEYKEMIKLGMLDYLSKELRNEIQNEIDRCPECQTVGGHSDSCVKCE